MWGELKERGTSKGLSYGLQSKDCVLSHACYVLPVAAPGERAGGGHVDEADSFFLRTFGEHSGPLLSCTESTSSAEWPRLCGGGDLLFVLQRAGWQCLPDPVWPQPKAEHNHTGSPQDQATERRQLFASLLALEGARQL